MNKIQQQGLELELEVVCCCGTWGHINDKNLPTT